MPGQIQLLQVGQSRLWLDADKVDSGYKANALGVSFQDDSTTFRFHADVSIFVPNLLVDPATSALRPISDLETEARSALGRLREQLRSFHFEGTLLDLPLANSFETWGGLEIAANGQTFALQARARFKVAGKYGGADFAADLTVALRIADTVPQLDIDLPLPGIAIHLPKLPVPNLRIPQHLDLGTAFSGWAAHLTAIWTNRPELNLIVNDNQIAIKIDGVAGGPAVGQLQLNNAPVLAIDQLEVSGPLDALNLALTLSSTAATQTQLASPDLSDPLHISWQSCTIEYRFEAADCMLVSTITIAGLEVHDGDQANAILLDVAFKTRLQLNSGSITSELVSLQIQELTAAIKLPGVKLSALNGLRRIIFGLSLDASLPTIEPFLRKLGRILSGLVGKLGGVAGAGNGLLGLARGASEMFAKLEDALVQFLRFAQSAESLVAIELRWDAQAGRLAQIIITPLYPSGAADGFKLGGPELSLTFPAKDVALIIDVADGWAAIAQMPSAKAELSLETDLWIGSDARHDPVRDASDKPHAPLLAITAKTEGPLVLLALSGGGLRLFRQLADATTQEQLSLGAAKHLSYGSPYRLGPGAPQTDWDVKIADDAKERLTSLFPALGASGGTEPPIGITIDKVEIEPNPGNGTAKDEKTFSLLAKIEVRQRTLGAGGGTDASRIPVSINGHFALSTLTLRLDSASTSIMLDEVDFLGGKLTFDKKKADDPSLKLIIGDDVRLGLADDVTASIGFPALSTSGRGLVFDIAQFGIAGAGLDLDAQVRVEPITLPGLDTTFRFTEGRLRIERSRLLGASVSGSGELPRALLGEARINAALHFAETDSGFAVASASARLEKTGEPLVCENTRFRFELTHVGLKFEVVEQKPYFYGELTGTASFRPNAGEFTGTLLGRLPEIIIKLDRAPIAGDGRALARAISFQVPIEPPAQTKLFNLFEFELRGIGFHPSFSGWSDNPAALALSGQARFTESFDTVQPRFDFHTMYIAPPASGSALPRVRFDGLGVGLRVGAMGEIEASAVAVDDRLPTSLFSPDTLPANVTAKGFLASGRLRIRGWAPMSAAAGFLELETDARKRLAFFAYAQQERLSEPIPTPVGTLYLREVGFGFGFRYTLAGIAQTESVTDPRQLIQVLDPIARRQGDLSKFTAWEPEGEQDRLTLAMRALFSVTSASSSSRYNEEGEAELANPILFDVVAALRSDLTFLMTARAWIAANYADWEKSGASWSNQPSLTGYIYISAPKQTFLGRLVSDPKGYIGQHPVLPPQLVQAFRQVKFSSTLYIRPGLFHQEFGWPYELEAKLIDQSNAQLVVNGGVVLRIEDGAVLQGIAFRGRGFIQLGGSVGGSVGASATAIASFSLDGKFIAYVSVARPADTLFYGRLSLALSVALAIRFWVKFRFFSMSAGWEERLDIELDLEVAVGPKGIGAYARASISVRRFGRGLRLGISAGFGTDMLALARARVERFMALGLEASVPDPAAGLGPVSEAPRKSRLEKGDERLLATAQDADKYADTPKETTEPPPPPEPGEQITACSFYAVLMPRADGSYIMQLIPCDLEGSAQHSGGFFVAPGAPIDENQHGEDGYYAVTGDESLVGLLEKASLGTTSRAEGELRLHPDWDSPLEPADKELKLRHLIAGGFMGIPIKGGLTYTQPPVSAEAFAQTSPETTLTPKFRADVKGAHEARGAIIGQIGDLALRCASADLKELPLDQLTAPRLGLTFHVSDADVAALFDDSNRSFAVHKSDAGRTEPGAGKVKLLNPPKSHFSQSPPLLVDAKLRRASTGLIADWDLQSGHPPIFSDERDDPDTQLHHYEVRRYFSFGEDMLFERRTQSRPAVVAHAGDDLTTSRDLPPPFQLIDDLADLPEGLKSAMTAAKLDEQQGGDIERAYLAWLTHFQGRDVTVHYDVIPVDNAGTRSKRVHSVSFALSAPRTLRGPAILSATAELGKVKDEVDRRLLLSLQEPVWRDSLSDAALTLTFTVLQIGVAVDDGPKSGVFGDDLLDESQQGGRVGREPAGLKTYKLKLVPKGTGNIRILVGDGEQARSFAAIDPGGLFETLGLNDDKGEKPIRARRLFVRPVYDDSRIGGADWCEATLLLVAERPKGGLLRVPVPAFEPPIALANTAVLHHDDISAEAGLLWLRVPTEDALFPPDPEMFDAIRDPDRRSAIRLRWVARPNRTAPLPSSPGVEGKIDPNLIGGFAIHVASRAYEYAHTVEEFVRNGRSLGIVRTRPHWLSDNEPSRIEDFSKLEAHYPSDAARLKRTAWFSSAESDLLWPELMPRRSLMIVPDEGLIGELFSKGVPTSIKVTFTVDGKLQPLVVNLPNGTKIPLATGTAEPGALRRQLRDLCWDYSELVTAGSGVLRFEVEYPTGPGNSIDVRIDLAPDLHPILADTIDLLRYDWRGGAATDHRPFEPILEGMPPPAPGTNAQTAAGTAPSTSKPDLRQLFNDSAPTKDPAGWAALRHLGLAAGLRLYDTASGTWLKGDALNAQINGAFREALRRYRDVKAGFDTGIPFVELIYDQEDIHAVGSPDGFKPSHKPASKPLFQLALRPYADRLDGGTPNRGVVHYLEVVRHRAKSGSASPPLIIDGAKLEENVWLEVAYDDPQSGATVRRWLGKSPPDWSFSPISQLSVAGTVDRFFVRLIGASGSKAEEIVGKCLSPIDEASAHLWQGTPLDQVTRSSTPAPGGSFVKQPYGVFGELPVELYQATTFPPPPPGPTKPDGGSRFIALAERRFAAPAMTAELAVEYRKWSARFFEHGSAGIIKSTGALRWPVIRFAAAAIVGPASQRQSVDANGRVSILYLDKSRLGAWLRFVIKPTGRYDELLRAVDRPVREHLVPADLADGHWVDVALPRTLPVAKPTVLAADHDRASNALIVVAAFSDDEILAQANNPQAVSRQAAGTGIRWQYHFAHEAWADRLGLPSIDHMTPVKLARPDPEGLRAWVIDRAKPPPPVDTDKTLLDECARADADKLQRLPDLWRGAHAWAAHDLPYFLDLSASLYAAAGNAVSETTTVSLPATCVKQPSELRLGALEETDSGWKFTIDLIRFVDLVPDAIKDRWYGPSADLRALMELPDPLVTYRLFLSSIDNPVRSAEVDIVADESSAEFKAKRIGSAFEKVATGLTLGPQPVLIVELTPAPGILLGNDSPLDLSVRASRHDVTLPSVLVRS
jgi:hypothetical protein